ncbi:MAG: CHASE2 domain-containing protein [Candidatus Omnitrophica bacterium]|jgi:CHASE2 domain-containing sensor protein|nr:CHASE2 domain-containing protein [Candidatus Omnitrophota bacterium]
MYKFKSLFYVSSLVFFSDLKKKISIKFLIIFFACLSVFLLSYFRVFNNYELIFYDLKLILRPSLPVSDKIIIIEVADDTVKNLGKWPLPRDFHGSLIRVLKEYGVKQIIIDVLFAEPTLNDEMFRAALEESGNVYLPVAFYPQDKNKKTQSFAESEEMISDIRSIFKIHVAGYGHINTFIDSDGKVRRIPLFIKYKDKLFPHLSLAAACNYLGLKVDKVLLKPGTIIIDDKLSIPVSSGASFLVNYPAKWKDSFLHLSYFEILKAYSDINKGKTPYLNLSMLKDKICFVGLTATGTSDLRAIPVEKSYPMLGLQASVFNSIIQKKFIRDIGACANALIGIIIFLTSLSLCLKFAPLKAFLINIALGAVYFFGTFIFLMYGGILIDSFFPLFIIVITYSASGIYKFLREERKRQILENELDIARTIQRSFLPQAAKEFNGIAVASFMQAAKFVAGDLYDIVELDKNKLGILIGDVSGKGVSAALIMAQAISQFRIFCRQNSNCSTVLNMLNKELYGKFQGSFVTCLYIIIDISQNLLHISSAGHAPLFVYKNSSRKLIDVDLAAGFPLGIIEEVSYEEVRCTIGKGDKLFLFTDGLYEARNSKGEEFGIENVKKLILQNASLDTKTINEAIRENILKFSDSREQHDDITFIVAGKEL